jgi:hypothetical protein
VMTKLKSEWIHVSKNCHGGKYKIHLKQSETGKWKHCFEYVDGTWTDWIPCLWTVCHANRMGQILIQKVE